MRTGDFLLGAARIRAEAASKRGDSSNGADLQHAESWEARALIPLDGVEGTLAEPCVGGELLPANEFGRGRQLRNTVGSPTYITADASRDRLDLAFEAGALELALDTAETIEADNSLEKMLAHQLASAHHSAMTLTAQLNRCVERMDVIDRDSAERASVQGVRLAGAVARMMASYQSGLLTLQRLRTGGRQVVTVQHVTIEDGGQAVVAGKVSGRGARRRKGERSRK
jgi:hypothetical protein